MSAAPTEIIKKPLSWAKASPWVFGIFLFLIVIVVVRFRESIAAFFAKAAGWPVIGGVIGFLTGVGKDKGPPATAAT